jgi:hypothetical protein
MTIEEIREYTPYERLCYWIKERESIRLKKEAGKPLPYTTDPILQQFKFCNVKRADDKVSRWLITEWYDKNYDHPNTILATTLARQLNNPDSLGAIGYPTKWSPSRVEKILNDRASKGLKNFSAAYMITGTLGGTKVQQIVWKVVDAMHRNRPVIDTSSIENTVKALLPYAGFSTFIAGQVTADLVWSMNGTWADKCTYAPIGPGSRRGMNRVLGNGPNAPMKQPEFNKYLTKLIAKLNRDIPASIMSRLVAQDVQSVCCEVDKYNRVLFGEGRPKQIYKGI